MNRLLQALLSFFPTLFTVPLVYMLAEDWIDFGGGDKDILLALPYLIWTLVLLMPEPLGISGKEWQNQYLLHPYLPVVLHPDPNAYV